MVLEVFYEMFQKGPSIGISKNGVLVFLVFKCSVVVFLGSFRCLGYGFWVWVISRGSFLGLISSMKSRVSVSWVVWVQDCLRLFFGFQWCGGMRTGFFGKFERCARKVPTSKGCFRVGFSRFEKGW